MKRNNINLISTDGNKYKFVIDLEQTYNYSKYLYSVNTSKESYFYKNIPFIKETNNIYKKEFLYSKEYNIRQSKVKLYFPEYKPEFFTNLNYLIEIYIMIENKKVILYSDIHNINECIANENIFKLNEVVYYEYLDFLIPSPEEILFSDDWKEFRNNLNNNNYIINSSVINISITPLTFDNQIHSYINIGNTSIQVNHYDIEYCTAILNTNIYESTNNPCFYINWKYNSSYKDDWEGFKKYISDNYFIENPIIRYQFIVYDNETIFEDVIEYEEENLLHKFNYDDCLLKWDLLDFQPKAIVKIDFIKERKDNIYDEEIIYSMKSTILELIPDIFKYFAIESDDNKLEIHNINLNIQDMNIYNFNVVNKIQKNIIELERPKDYKSNIIKPIFYKVKELNNININSQVTENISLNLDSYKSKTSCFYLQIEGIIFNQIGISSSGIIFKIVGNKLPGIVTKGTY